MNWGVRATTVEDAEYIYDHAWERGLAELRAYGLDRLRWVSRCMNMIATRNCCVTFVKDGNPIALLGVEKAGDLGRTWFQATTEAKSEITMLTRQVRRWMKQLAREAGLHTTLLFSLCVSPDAARWFAFLGFREDLHYMGDLIGGRRERCFVRNWE